MTQSSPQPPKKFRGKLTRKILLQLLPVMMIPVAILGVVTLYNSNNFLRQQVLGQFTNVSNALAEQIDHLVNQQRAFFVDLVSDPNFVHSLNTVVSTEPGTPDWDLAREQFLQAYADNTNSQKQHSFDNLVVITPDNEVLVSTKPEWEGKLLDPEVFGVVLDAPTSALLYNHYPFNYPLHEELDNSLILLTSQRILDSSGNLNATLIGVTNTPKFQRILEASELSHPEVRTYFITSLSGDTQFLWGCYQRVTCPRSLFPRKIILNTLSLRC